MSGEPAVPSGQIEWLRAGRDVARLTTTRPRQQLLQAVCDRLMATGLLDLCAGAMVVDGAPVAGAYAGDPVRRGAVEELLARRQVPDCARVALEGGRVEVRRDAGPRCGAGCSLAPRQAPEDAVALPLGDPAAPAGVLVVAGPLGLADDAQALEALRGVAVDLGQALARAPGALFASEARLRAFVLDVPAPVALLDRELRYLATSRRWSADFGLGDADLVGRSHYEVFPDLPEAWRAVHQRCLAGAAESCDDDTFVRSDGRTEHLNWAVRPWRDDAGQVAGLIMFCEVTTPRREAERRLQSQAQLLAETGALARVGGWELDAVTGQGTWTDEVARIHDLDPGVQPSVELGLSFYRGESAARLQAALGAAVERGQPYDLELELTTARGARRWVRTIGRPVVVEGRVVRVRGSIQDVTDRKQTESALVAERVRLRTLVDTIPDLVWLKDPNGVFLACNRRFEQLLGAPEAEILGKTDYDFVPRDLADFFRANDRRAVAQGAPTMNEEQVTFADGHCELLQTIKTPMRGHDGRLVGVLGIARDMTAAREAQAELERAHAELRKLSRAVEQGPAMVVITDLQGRIEYVNPRLCQVTGWTAEELVGQNPRLLKSERTPPELHQDLWRTVSAGKEWRGELVNRKKSGALYTARVVISPIRDPQGVVTHYVSLSEDVSEARRNEASLRETREQLLHAQKMEAVGRLAGGVAHDFNNLLTVIEGFARLVAEEPGLGERARHRLEQVVLASERAAGLTRQLLAFTRKLPTQPRVLGLGAVVRETESMLRRLLGEQLELRLTVEPDAGEVLMDRGQLEQVVMNLAINARDATPVGGRIQIEVSSASLDGSEVRLRPRPAPGWYVRLAVIDSGCGMPPAVLARLFEPYFSTKPAGKGTGLGLATVYAIVEQCRAAIGVESEPGRGSRFEVYFPRQDTPAPAPPPETAPIEGLGGSETILLAEDDESVRELVADVLSGAGYHVLDGGLPLATLALAASYPGRIDLLLSDLVMPDLDGHELARRLLLLRPGLTTLFMSGYPGETPPEGSPISWLSKPVRPTHLLRAVREALDRAARSRGAS